METLMTILLFVILLTAFVAVAIYFYDLGANEMYDELEEEHKRKFKVYEIK